MSISNLVLSIADNKQMLGLRYAEWATRAPSLEADIAAAAMGLDDLGHSRVLYGCLEPLGADPDHDAVVEHHPVGLAQQPVPAAPDRERVVGVSILGLASYNIGLEGQRGMP